MRCDTRRQPSRYRHVIIATALAVALLAPIVPVTAQAQGSRANQWVGTWASGPVALPPSAAPAGNPPEASPFGNPPRIANQTLRQIVRTSIGGSQVRVALTNRFGTTPLRIGGAHVAIREKGSAIVELMEPNLMTMYARVCATELARAHARSGDCVAIASYLGSSDTFDRAVAQFAEAYADQNERDYETLIGAVKTGLIKAESGV